jgi:hypothetical protein
MAFSPNLFLANAKLKDGFAKTNRFEVILPIPRYVSNFALGQQTRMGSFIDSFINNATNAVKDVTGFITGRAADSSTRMDGSGISRYLAMQCESASLPGKSLMTTDIDIYGPTFKIPFKTQLEDSMQLTFICTNEFYERKLFEKWLSAINPPNTYNLRYQKDNATKYCSDITIIQYDEFIKKIFSVKLIDAFPTQVAPMALNWADEGFHRLGVTFTYRRYEILYEGSYDLVQAATTILGSAGTRLFDAVQKKIFF